MAKKHLIYTWDHDFIASYKITPRSQREDPEKQNINDTNLNYSYQKTVLLTDLNKLREEIWKIQKDKSELLENDFVDEDTIKKFRSHYLIISLFWRIPQFFIKDFKKLYPSAEFKCYKNFNREVIIRINSWDLKLFMDDMKVISEYKSWRPEFINQKKFSFCKLIKHFSYYWIQNRINLSQYVWSTFFLQFFNIWEQKKEDIKNTLLMNNINLSKVTSLIYKFEINDSTKDIFINYLQVFDDIQHVYPAALEFIIDPIRWLKEVSQFSLNTSHNDYDNIPTVWVIDSWIFNQREILKPLIDVENSKSFIDSNPFIDSLVHWTSVASLVTFWKQIHLWNKELLPYAKLISIKIISSDGCNLPLDWLFNIVKTYYDMWIRIFNMSLNYISPKQDNQSIGLLTYLLDYQLSQYNDILFFISAWNVPIDKQKMLKDRYHESINYKFDELTNICIPADSTNSISVWSINWNWSISVFSRKNSIDYWDPLTIKKLQWGRDKITTRISTRSSFNYKPDFIELWENVKILSNDYTEEVTSWSWTSFSSPIVCNFACQLKAKYPNISWNSIIALLLNSCSSNNINLELNSEDWINLPEHIKKRNQQFSWWKVWSDTELQNVEMDLLKQRYSWFWKIDENKFLTSSEKRVTFLIEDKIKLNSENIYKINIPESFKTRLLTWSWDIKLTWSLSYNHIPILTDHLNYNPIHVWFRLLWCSNEDMNEITKKIKELQEALDDSSEWTSEYERIYNEKEEYEKKKDKYQIKLKDRNWNSKSRSQDNYYWNHYANHQSLWNNNKIKKSTLNSKLNSELFIEIRCNLKTTDSTTNIYQEIRNYISDVKWGIINADDKVQWINEYFDQNFWFCLTIEDFWDNDIDIHQELLNANNWILQEIDSIELSTESDDIEINDL